MKQNIGRNEKVGRTVRWQAIETNEKVVVSAK